jgi:hypothetical protein
MAFVKCLLSGLVLCLVCCPPVSIAAGGQRPMTNGRGIRPGWDVGPCTEAKKKFGPTACFGCTEKDMGFRTFDPSPKVDETRTPERWLQIVIGTVPRFLALPYLVRTLRALRHQLPDPKTKDPFGNGAVHVKVANFRPKEHKVFDRIKAEFEQHHKSKNTFEFTEVDPVRCDPVLRGHWKYVPGLSPELHPRQQTRDVISLLLQSGYEKCENMLIMEDDFEVCPMGLHMIKLAIARADMRGWSTLRVGVGMSGILVKCSEIPPFIRYLMDNQNMMPVDLLYTEYFAGLNHQGRARFGDPKKNVRPFRVLANNLLDHLGVASTFKGRKARHVVGCGAKLMVQSFMKQESFQPKCQAAGMSPCEAGLASFGASVRYGFHRSGRRGMPGHIEITPGTIGESCTETCAKIESHCNKDGFSHLDDCNRVTSFFNCPNGCTSVVKEDQDFAKVSPGYISSKQHCVHYIQLMEREKEANKCEEKLAGVQRLCPCSIHFGNQDKK